MTGAERKIEAALEAHFLALGFVIDINHGDHFAEVYADDDDDLPYLRPPSRINLTECARFVADEVFAPQPEVGAGG